VLWAQTVATALIVVEALIEDGSAAGR
jgi:hypothetical protein